MVRTAKHFERYQRCCCCRYQCCEFVDRSVLLVGPWCWWDSGSGKTLWKISTPRPAWSWSAAINSTQERRNADIGLFAKSARDEHEHHKLNTKAQMGTKTKTTKIQWNRQMEDKDQKDMGKFPDFFSFFHCNLIHFGQKIICSPLKTKSGSKGKSEGKFLNSNFCHILSIWRWWPVS